MTITVSQFELAIDRQWLNFQLEKAPDGGWLFLCNEWINISSILTELAGGVVAWECKDYADGWIRFATLADALEYQEESGCIMRPVRAAQADFNARIQACLTSPAAEPVAWKGKTWLELREPGCVPQRTGPIPATEVAAFLREVFEHRPHAYVTVITIGYDGPSLQDGPECLQMLDGRSMSTGRKHIASSSAAHQGHPAPSASREVTVTDEMVLRSCQSEYPALFRHGLTPPEGSGLNSRKQMETIIERHRSALTAALLAALPEREG